MTEAPAAARDGGRSTLHWMLLIGALTFFLLPFMQLWSVEAVPLFLSDSYRQAAVAAENLMATAQAGPSGETLGEPGFRPLKSTGGQELEGRVEVQPHPELPGLSLIRVQVRWGWFPFRKIVTLESAVTQTRP